MDFSNSINYDFKIFYTFTYQDILISGYCILTDFAHSEFPTYVFCYLAEFNLPCIDYRRDWVESPRLLQIHIYSGPTLIHDNKLFRTETENSAVR